MRKIKGNKAYGAFEYVIVASFVIIISIFLFKDTSDTIDTSSKQIRKSFLEMFQSTAE